MTKKAGTPKKPYFQPASAREWRVFRSRPAPRSRNGTERRPAPPRGATDRALQRAAFERCLAAWSVTFPWELQTLAMLAAAGEGAINGMHEPGLRNPSS